MKHKEIPYKVLMFKRPSNFLRFYLILAFFFALVILSIFWVVNMHSYQRLKSREHTHFQTIKDILMSGVRPRPGKSIFFLETKAFATLSNKTSLNPMELKYHKSIDLTTLQACAVESAALHNPESEIFVFFVRAMPLGWTFIPELIQTLLSYPNVNLNSLDPWNITSGTPIENFFKKGLIFESIYPVEHLSDLLRVLVLWRWGGTYLDLDTISLSTLADLPPNYLGVESELIIANAVINFAARGIGHRFARDCLKEFQASYNPNAWSYNGPQLLTRILERWCMTSNKTEMMGNSKCQGMQILPSYYFFAIPYQSWQKFFQPESQSEALDQIQNSYLTHIWNHMSKGELAKGNPTGAFKVIAEENCPKVYQEMIKDKIVKGPNKVNKK